MEMVTKSLYNSMACPFVTGGVVTGEQFIGRSEYIKRSMRKLKRGNSVALRGIPRVGKTSLAKMILVSMREMEGLLTVPVYVDFGTCESFSHFWREITKQLKTELENVGTDLQLLLERVENVGDKYENIKDAVEKLFAYQCRHGMRVIICIDEFDSVARVFSASSGDPLSYFMFFRTLMTNAREYGLSFIIVSRRSLASLESKADGGSTFDGAIETLPVRGFGDKELSEFREYAAKHGLKLSDIEWNMVIEQSGRSPFMLSKTADMLLDAEQSTNIEVLLHEYEPTHYPYFDLLLELMSENERKDLKSMIKLFVGPQYDLNANDINELKHAGYLWQEKDNAPFETISSRFQQYLVKKTRNTLDLDIWPLLTETEKLMRDFIETKLRGLFEDDWEKELMIEAEKQAAEKKNFISTEKIEIYQAGKAKVNRLIDTLSFLEYQKIIQKYYDSFKVNFGGIGFDKFRKYTEKLYQVRNPFAHSNGNLLSNLEVQEADLACKKLINLLSANKTDSCLIN